MNKTNIVLWLFAGFAFGLPIWAMQQNSFPETSISDCSGECYRQWKEGTGGVVAVAQADAAAKAAASPAELGQRAYAGCVACHGPRGQGGIGPQLAGQPATAIAAKLLQYKNGETLGNQSALMWSQAALLSPADIENIAAYTATF